MDKIAKYIECYIPTETCNLRCHYCYITQKRKFNQKLAAISHSRQELCAAFAPERLGGFCLLNFCAGGETLLAEQIVDVLETLLSLGHYVMVVTNGTMTERFTAIAQFPAEYRERLMFKFSFHYLEFKRLGWLERFAANVNTMRAAGCSVTVEITPSDELIPYIEEVKAFSLAHFGAVCHVTIARDDRTRGIDHLSAHPFEEYKKIWGSFDSELFAFKSSIFYQKRREYCYAGQWSFWVNIETGETRQCYFGQSLGNFYDLSHPLHFKAVGYGCRLAHCYNGHAFLTLGDIPGLAAPTYAQVRDRPCTDGTTWLQPRYRDFISGRLYETNKQKSRMILMAEKLKHMLDRE